MRQFTIVNKQMRLSNCRNTRNNRRIFGLTIFVFYFISRLHFIFFLFIILTNNSIFHFNCNSSIGSLFLVHLVVLLSNTSLAFLPPCASKDHDLLQLLSSKKFCILIRSRFIFPVTLASLCPISNLSIRNSDLWL